MERKARLLAVLAPVLNISVAACLCALHAEAPEAAAYIAIGLMSVAGYTILIAAARLAWDLLATAACGRGHNMVPVKPIFGTYEEVPDRDSAGGSYAESCNA
jgi:hypothetical protein